MNKILVCRIGAFGDVCMALPVVHALSEHMEVHWLIRRGHDAVLELFPDVRCRPVLFESEASHDLAALATALSREEYDALIDLSNWRVVAKLAGRLKTIPVRAIAYDSTRRLALQRIRNALPWLRPFNTIVEIDGAVHRVFKWQQLIKGALGCELAVRWPLRPVTPPRESIRVFVHPHASKRDKLWSIENFALVVIRLAERMPTRCLINQGRNRERRAAEALETRLREAGVDVAPIPFDSSFAGLKHALENVDFAVGPDSGPMHLASLLGVPSVVLYGPSSPSEVAPLWRTVAVTPTDGRGAMRSITPAMVTDGISRVFAQLFDRSDVGVRI